MAISETTQEGQPACKHEPQLSNIYFWKTSLTWSCSVK